MLFYAKRQSMRIEKQAFKHDYLHTFKGDVSMTLNQLKYFSTVAECLSMTKAAGKLYVTHSTISRGISDLEAELKLPLFTRENHQLMLTEAGQLLLKHCRQIQLDIDNLNGDMAALASSQKKSCEYPCPPSMRIPLSFWLSKSFSPQILMYF